MMTDQDEGPPPEFYTLPSLEDVEFWERYHAVGLNNPEPQPRATRNGDYTWIDLTDPSYSVPPAPPSIEGILYGGRRHVISGPPESTKTLVAYLLLLTALRQNEGVAILDFEMGPHAAVTLLRELGATDEELSFIHYTEPDGPPSSGDIERMLGLGVGYCLIDAAAGAYDVTGLDDNARKDAEKFAAQWIRPLWQQGVATIVIDHVVKDAENRGNWVIGSERKIGQCDVHLQLETLKQITRGGDGTVKINVKRDRPGHLQRPTSAIIKLVSAPDTYQIRATITEAEPIHADQAVKHTIYAERVSRKLEENAGQPMSQSQLEQAGLGGNEYVIQGARELVEAGYATVENGPRGAKLYTLLKPFRKAEYDLPTTSPPPPRGEVTHLASDPPRISTEIRVGGSKHGDDIPRPNDLPTTEQPRVDIFDPDIQALLDDPEY